MSDILEYYEMYKNNPPSWSSVEPIIEKPATAALAQPKEQNTRIASEMLSKRVSRKKQGQSIEELKNKFKQSQRSTEDLVKEYIVKNMHYIPNEGLPAYENGPMLQPIPGPGYFPAGRLYGKMDIPQVEGKNPFGVPLTPEFLDLMKKYLAEKGEM